MLPRKPCRASLKQAALDHAKAILKERGWTYRVAAPVVNVSFSHFAQVLCGQRESRALLHRIANIPPAPERKEPEA